jgi:uncharacterized protein YndB with AHSA1/START domain
MSKTYSAQQSILIRAPAARVWQALTRPELVKQYFFGAQMTADWRVGGAITWRGQWEGKPYVDKGQVMVFEPERLLVTTYFSSLSGSEDKPENYNTVTYRLAESDGRTTLTIIQDNNRTQEAADHSAASWAVVLEALKILLEKPAATK